MSEVRVQRSSGKVGEGIEAVEFFDLILGDVHRRPNVTRDPGDSKYEMRRKNGNRAVPLIARNRG